MKATCSIKDLRCIFFILLILTVPAAAYDLDWGLTYQLDATEVGALSMNCAADGDYYIVYVDETEDQLESAVFHANNVTNAVVTDLDSPQYAYNDIDFGFNIPMTVYYDYVSDGLMTDSYLAGSWGTPVELPYTNGARDVHIDLSDGVYHIAYCYDEPGTDNCFLYYVSNPGGSWFMETIALMSHVGIIHQFDMDVDSEGVPHFVWWDHTTSMMKYAVRNGPDDYTIENLYDDPVGCQWVELEFLYPDLPFVGFLDNGDGTRTVRLAYKFGDDWYDEEIYDNPDIQAIDMGSNRNETITTMDYYFAFSTEDNLYYIQRTYTGWETKTVPGVSSYAPADWIRAEWNEALDEFGFVWNAPNSERLFLKIGSQILPTATPTPPPTSTPTTGPGTPTNTPIPTNTPTTIPTNTPTFTPTTGPGTPTNTPLPTSTPTPECTELGVSIDMPLDMYLPGSLCYCHVRICNPDSETYENTPLMVILDVYGDLFFAPSFGSFDHYVIDVTPGAQVIEVLPPFVWPTGSGAASNIWFYAGMTDPDVTELFGNFDVFSFGWSS